MALTEDIDYTSVSDFATPEDEEKVDEDQPNKSILVELSEDMEKDIARHNSFDVIQVPANATPEQKIAAFDDMAIHKGLAIYLQGYKLKIDNKIKELK